MANQAISAVAEVSAPQFDDVTVWVDTGSTTRYKISAARLGGLLSRGVCNGRLTTESGVPVSPADRIAQGTIYFALLDGNLIDLYDGTRWAIFAFAQPSLALTVTSGNQHDVFGYNNAGTLTLELSSAYTNDTTRADALVLQDGILVKSGATTRRWLGTIRASGTNVTEDSYAKRFVWSAYNQVLRPMAALPIADSWTYATATYRQANADAANQLDFVVGATTLVSAEVNVHTSSPASSDGGAGIGLDSTTAPITTSATGGYTSPIGAGNTVPNSEWCRPRIDLMITAGRHTLVWLEIALNGTLTMNGDAGGYGTNIAQSGISGRLMG